MTPSPFADRAEQYFRESLATNDRRISHVFAVLMVAQWLAGIAIALSLSPWTWAEHLQAVHPHLALAVLLGGVLSGVPIALAVWRPSAFITRLVVACSQTLWSALLIYLTGGRIETHFHVFVSLAFISFYRDWRIMIPATLVVVGDNLVRGLLSPESVYGIANPEWWRFLEHASWVALEDLVLIFACVRGVQDTRQMAARQAELEWNWKQVNQFNEELDRRVHERTQQLSESNERLGASLETLSKTQHKLLEASRKAGMADVATSVLHNVGNVLNGMMVSAGVLQEKLGASSVRGVARLSELFAEPELSAALGSSPKGKKIGPYLSKLSTALTDENGQLSKEVEGMRAAIEHVKTVIREQQTHARAGAPVTELLSPRALLESVLEMSGLHRGTADVEVVWETETLSSLPLDRHKVSQILLNLVGNARQAITQRGEGPKRITLRATKPVESKVIFEVQDTGCGIDAEHLSRIFQRGFTTKSDGHGFGLHSSACQAMELGGRLHCRSEGLGQGATFVLELPVNAEQVPAAA